MKPNLTNASASNADFMRLSPWGPSIGSVDTGATSSVGTKLIRQAGGMQHLPNPRSWKSAYIAFIATVFACVAAAATVASHDMPLLIGGF